MPLFAMSSSAPGAASVRSLLAPTLLTACGLAALTPLEAANEIGFLEPFALAADRDAA